jgi:hypothetical protein
MNTYISLSLRALRLLSLRAKRGNLWGLLRGPAPRDDNGFSHEALAPQATTLKGRGYIG